MKAFCGLAALFLFAAVNGAAYPSPLPSTDEFQQVCNTTDYTGSVDALPTFPRQFSVRVEANILNKERTIWLHEAYDDVNNRGRLTFSRNGTREMGIFDYENDEIFIIPDVDDGTECSVHPLSQSRLTNMTFGFTRMNGSIHIGSARTFLERINDDSAGSQGPFIDSVRGVLADRYQLCNNQENISFIADYYYTVANWSYATLGSSREVDRPLAQIIIRGNSLLGGELHNFYHIYSILGLETGPESVPDHLFTVPTGLACVGRIAGKPLPALPNFFSTYIMGSVTGMADNTFREYYDFNHRLARFDYYLNDENRAGLDAGPYQTIHDFNSLVAYTINRHTSNCTVTSLADGRPGGDIVFDEDGTPQIASPTRLFLLGDSFNFSYEGVSTVRGVEVESWVSIRDVQVINPFVNISNAVYEIFFTRPGYRIQTDRSAGTEVVPWRMILRGVITYFVNVTTGLTNTTNLNYVADYFDFSASEPPYDVYDTAVCFSGNQSHTVIFVLPVPVEGIDFSILRTNLRAGLVKATNLKPLQVNRIQLAADRGDHVVVTVYLTDLSELAQVGENDTVVTAQEAAEFLETTTDSLPFQVDVGNGVMVTPEVITSRPGRPDSNCSNIVVTLNNTCPTFPTSPPPMTTPTCPPTAASTVQKTSTTAPTCVDNFTSRLTDGVITGIAVGLFFAGFLLALLVLLIGYCCVKVMCRGESSLSSSGPSAVKYKKHDNELESIS